MYVHTPYRADRLLRQKGAARGDATGKFIIFAFCHASEYEQQASSSSSATSATSTIEKLWDCTLRQENPAQQCMHTRSFSIFHVPELVGKKKKKGRT